MARMATAHAPAPPGRPVLVVAGTLHSSGAVPLLRQTGHAITVADSGPQALALLTERRFDAVLCELEPTLEGHDLIRSLRAACGEARLVVVARSGTHPALLEALREVPFAHLEEPFEAEDLATCVERVVVGLRDRQRTAFREARWRRADAVLRGMNAARDRDHLLAFLKGALPGLFAGERCSIYAYDEGCLSLAVATHEAPAAGLRLPLAGAALGELALKDLPIVLRGQDPHALSSLLVPGYVQDELVAVMVVERSPGTDIDFDEDDVRFHQAIVAHVGSALRVRERTAALEAALMNLREVQGELSRIERIAAVGKLAFDVSHELKNRLTSMTFAVQNVRDAVATGGFAAPVLDSLALLDDDIRRMRDRVEAFYAMGRGGHGRLERCAADEIVGQVLARFRTDPRARFVAFREDLVAPAFVRADREQLFSAITNLVINAIEAVGSRPGGEIGVTVRPQDQRVQIAVLDNGPGVPPEMRDRIFDAFYGTKPKGTGLGLSQVFLFAEQSGGRVYLADSVQGACFIIELPEAPP
jgi:signal transduction histidine kinase